MQTQFHSSTYLAIRDSPQVLQKEHAHAHIKMPTQPSNQKIPQKPPT